MEYCRVCGTKLIEKELKNEGMIPYCNSCQSFCFPHYNVAVSMVITTKDFKKTLLIEQYNQKRYILVAGYVAKGETAEDAAKREIKEEVGLEVEQLLFQKTAYYAKSNTLMINFIAVVKEEKVTINEEVDDYKWLTLLEAKKCIAKGSLAEEFFLMFFEMVNKSAL